ncbi:MAG: DUF1292 domain-containing protein [Clostridia bacterium]|nr:DUF1292 domain-containing protein [Clostridia bacterium]
MQGQIIQLESDGGKKAFELLMMFDDNNSQYAAFSEIENDEGIVIMKMIEEDGEYIFETIESELKAQELFVKFLSLWETEEEDD